MQNVVSTQTVNGSTYIDLLNLLGYWKHSWMYDFKPIILSDYAIHYVKTWSDFV